MEVVRRVVAIVLGIALLGAVWPAADVDAWSPRVPRPPSPRVVDWRLDTRRPAASTPTLPGAPGCPVFPASNVWNRRIDDRAVATDSSTMIAAIGLTRGLHMDFGSYAGYGIPYQVVGAATTRSTVTFEYDDESDHVGYPIPTDPLIEGGPGATGDRHIIMVDRDACRSTSCSPPIDPEHLACRQRRHLGPALQRAPPWAGQRRCRRAADPPGWCATTRSRPAIRQRFVSRPMRREPVRYPARHFASDSNSASLPPMGLRVSSGVYDTSGLSAHAV